MTPSRPYLLRAFYEWLVDNDLTPHLVVDADQPDVEVPRQFVQNGQIVLNIAPAAVTQLQMTNDVVSCSARFGGKPELLYVPMWAVKAIYARENGAGTVFEAEPGYRDMLAQMDNVDEGSQPSEAQTTVASDDDKPTPPSGPRPTLRVVK
ncbi:ClpXP protease specificity-enhancing factor [Neiella marina]|uniref:ClpXP protease specificity-enhancing factor n=1 Tax=Neiella holothuriorum TaxID=2870530 RepID=A0ABS7EB02_9GAMM|nr:ClpXP protease specificity-enhancing factor [Neiella holothuriorum]MBW8189497.1 ClpXP protease specificity-enhancing factor [Neiella holothuriorum]